MQRLKGFFKRAFRYIVKGQPEVIVKVQTASVTSGAILSGKHILITGGTRGLGYAIAKRCLEEGAFVSITGRSQEGLQKAKEELGNPEKLFTIVHDVTDTTRDESVIAEAASKMKGLDTLVNNAGISIHGIDYLTCSEKQWDAQMDTNLKGVYFMTQAFLRFFLKKGTLGGNIIIMTSERGLYGDDVPYGLAKRALISYTEGLAVRLINKGIRVNAIAPGVTATDMTGYSAEGNLYRRWARGKRVLLAEEIAETAVFLISDVSSSISGQVIACNEANHLK